MATTSAYPKVSERAWRTLRSRATNAPSTRFTPSNVAAMLGMSSPKSAGDNVVYPMRRLGLFDEDGTLTPRGQKWRVDASYAEACDEMIAAVYPEDLAALTTATGAPDFQQIKTWFDHRGFGDSNARSMAATYVMIASKKLPDGATSDPTVERGTKKGPTVTRSAASRGSGSGVKTPQSGANGAHDRATNGGPDVHLDIQIHIPADASAEQIDHIFASMAKHLYGRVQSG